MKLRFLAIVALLFNQVSLAVPIAYQGKLERQGAAFSGEANLEFRLFDSDQGGTQIGPTISKDGTSVINGFFSVSLDFGEGAFGQDQRYLEVSINGTTLNPRQLVTAAPIATFALDGNPGPQGPQGETGATGPQGLQGEQGATGAQGPQGETGATGPQGPQGIAGADGLSLLNGAVAPDASVGAVGDFYIDTVARELYGPKTESGWGSAVALVGPQGPQGETGAQGPQGQLRIEEWDPNRVYAKGDLIFYRDSSLMYSRIDSNVGNEPELAQPSNGGCSGFALADPAKWYMTSWPSRTLCEHTGRIDSFSLNSSGERYLRPIPRQLASLRSKEDATLSMGRPIYIEEISTSTQYLNFSQGIFTTDQFNNGGRLFLRAYSDDTVLYECRMWWGKNSDSSLDPPSEIPPCGETITPPLYIAQGSEFYWALYGSSGTYKVTSLTTMFYQ